jgi:phosphoglycolate phosphatase
MLALSLVDYHRAMPPIQAVLIDLDGTLVDTACEIATAANRMLEEAGLAPLVPGSVERMIGRGVRTLVERALAEARGGALIEVDRAVERFEAHYAQTVGTEARLFPGALEGLRRFAASGIPMAVVTNKPRVFTKLLLDRLEVASYFPVVVTGDDGLPRKPAGDMFRAACERLASEPWRSLVLGDSDNDVLAARAAGCPVWCVPYGYNEGRDPRTLACDRHVGTIDEAARLVLACNRGTLE